MATYATQTDFENYVEGWVTSDPDALERLLTRAEDDIDRMFPANVLTDALQGITMTGVDGGNFMLALEWFGDMYTTDPIPFDADVLAVLDELNDATNVMGLHIPGPNWDIPEAPELGPTWAQGPLPDVPVVVQAIGELSEQAIPVLTVTANLTPVDATVAVAQLRGGGTRLDIWQMPGKLRAKLRNATCAQAEYRNYMGEEFFVRAQWDSVTGPELTTSGKLPLIGPKAQRELQGAGLLQYGARARISTPSNVAVAYMPSGGTPIPDDWRQP